jgi:hypothetical protein
MSPDSTPELDRSRFDGILARRLQCPCPTTGSLGFVVML